MVIAHLGEDCYEFLKAKKPLGRAQVSEDGQYYTADNEELSIWLSRADPDTLAGHLSAARKYRSVFIGNRKKGKST